MNLRDALVKALNHSLPRRSDLVSRTDWENAAHSILADPAFRAALLDEVERLSGERVALIREAVVELEGEYAGKILYPTLIRRGKVLDIIEGEMT
jgi:hypothetical protein